MRTDILHGEDTAMRMQTTTVRYGAQGMWAWIGLTAITLRHVMWQESQT